jgi:hypothetical protein
MGETGRIYVVNPQEAKRFMVRLATTLATHPDGSVLELPGGDLLVVTPHLKYEGVLSLGFPRSGEAEDGERLLWSWTGMNLNTIRRADGAIFPVLLEALDDEASVVMTKSHARWEMHLVKLSGPDGVQLELRISITGSNPQVSAGTGWIAVGELSMEEDQPRTFVYVQEGWTQQVIHWLKGMDIVS